MIEYDWKNKSQSQGIMISMQILNVASVASTINLLIFLNAVNPLVFIDVLRFFILILLFFEATSMTTFPPRVLQ